jgi:hypothetical protein
MKEEEWKEVRALCGFNRENTYRVDHDSHQIQHFHCRDESNVPTKCKGITFRPSQIERFTKLASRTRDTFVIHTRCVMISTGAWLKNKAKREK